MTLALFAGARVADFEAVLPWYERLFGGAPSFFAHATEAVRELAENRSVFIDGRRQLGLDSASPGIGRGVAEDSRMHARESPRIYCLKKS